MLDFNGVFVGTVVDNNDEKKLGRIKVLVPAVYGDIATEDLPWAQPSFPYTGDADKGFFFIPEKGSLVTVMFINGSPYSPIWIGGIYREEDNITPQVIKDNYPDRKVIKTNTGYILYDDKTNDIIIKHKSGSELIMNDDGTITLHSAADMYLLSDNNIYAKSKGNIYLNPDQSFNKTNRLPIYYYDSSYDDDGNNLGPEAGTNTIQESEPINEDSTPVEVHEGLWIYVYKNNTNGKAGIKNGKLYLVDGDKVVRTYVCATGINAGDKQREGDKKTPVGEYYIADGPINSANKTSGGGQGGRKPYGPFMWHIGGIPSRVGTGVALHGCAYKSPGIDQWCGTYGCVRLHNADILNIKPYVKKGMKIVIRNTPFTPKSNVASNINSNSSYGEKYS